MIYAKNLVNNRGAAIAHHIIITDGHNSILSSYGVNIAQKNGETGNVIIDKRYYQYSKTTSKYLSAFLNSNSKEIAKNLKDGVYQFGNLND